MVGIARGEVEILVHTTAPSRGPDDARYRALAQAYLDFEPLTRRGLEEEPRSSPMKDLDMQADSQLQEELLQSTQEERESAASYRPDEEEQTSSGASKISFKHDSMDRLHLSSLDSPSLSFNSTVNNAASPVFRGLVTYDQGIPDILPRSQGQDTSESWRPPPSVISDSQPESEKAVPAFSSPSRIQELYLQDLEGRGERSVLETSGETSHEKEGASAPQSSSQRIPSSVAEGMMADTSMVSNVPSSPSLRKSPRRSQRILRSIDNNTTSTQDPAFGLKRKWPECSSEDQNTSSSAPSKLVAEYPVPLPSTRSPNRRCTEPSTVEPGSKLDIVTSSKAIALATSSADSAVATSIWAESLEIRPSPPATSTTELKAEMLINEHLKTLASRMLLPMLYRPLSQSRDLRPMERGYWMVDCQKWNEGLRKRCWDCLGNYVGKNMAGWGVWCMRDEDHGEIRVYCWGVIVGHIYLLLYMASESKVKGTGACWISGDGEAIVKMSS
jgi:hypothetical protein